MSDAAQPTVAGFQRAGGNDAACHVCGEPLAGASTALCGTCDRTFHLRAREDGPGRDCGEVGMNDQWLTLDFTCLVCLGKQPASTAAEPPVGQGH